MAHLFRRAGFGATRDEIEAAVAKGYEATVEELLHPERQPDLDFDILSLLPRHEEAREIDVNQAYWLYRMVKRSGRSKRRWRCSGTALRDRLQQGEPRPAWSQRQIDMFRQHCLGDFQTLLLELSKDPAMIFWLDNQENTNEVHNENYGRELLELFSMGIGNYTEDDVKECARAFTGWGTQAPGQHRPVRPHRLGVRVPPRAARLRREDVPRRDRQLRRRRHHRHHRAAAGHRAVHRPAALPLLRRPTSRTRQRSTSWPRCSSESGGDIRAVVRALLLSDAFRSEAPTTPRSRARPSTWPASMRLVGDFRFPELRASRTWRYEFRYMGQDLMNPPSVEGWHTGKEWIDTGILVERINFAAEQVGDPDKPGVRAARRAAAAGGTDLGRGSSWTAAST